MNSTKRAHHWQQHIEHWRARVRQLSTENRLFYTPQPSIYAGFRFLDA
jgi:hypothetical protein